jgi:hypothetical protein
MDVSNGPDNDAESALPLVKEPVAVDNADEQHRRKLVAIALSLLVLVGLLALSEISSPAPRSRGTHHLDSGVIESASAYDVAPAHDGQAGGYAFGSSRDTRSFRDDKQIVVLLSSGRDSQSCARALVAAKDLAFRSSRVHFRVYEEIAVHHDDSCLQVFCELSPRDCKALLRTKRLQVTRRDVSGSLGASVGLHVLEGMVDRMSFENDFYLAVDANIEFTKHWDLELLKQWYSIGNDRAILSVSPPAIEIKGMNHGMLFLQCSARIHSKDPDPVVEFNPPEPKPLVKGDSLGAALLATVPVLQAQYSERFHFGLVSSLLSVRSDPHLAHLVVGHEYMRATRFWTKGFDFYAPARDILYYRYELPLAPHEKGETDAAIGMSSRRIRRLLKLPLSSPLFEFELLPDVHVYGPGENRSLSAWSSFSAIDATARFNESTTNHFAANCDRTLHYVHYE